MNISDVLFLAVVVSLPMIGKVIGDELYRRRKEEAHRISRITAELDGTEPFLEVRVPLEMRNLGVRRSFNPLDGSDYRVVIDDKGKWSVFPRQRLTDVQKASIAVLMSKVDAS